MATITRTHTFVDNAVLTAGQLNAEFDNALGALAIVNADISGSAAIAISKISLGISGSLVGTSDTQTFTNKRITRRVVTVTQSATPVINTDNTDVAYITGLAQAITSMTSSLSGTPVNGDSLIISITDDGTGRAITWGASFESSGNVTLPTTTVASTRLDVGFLWNTATSKWRCVAFA
ncbi:hypothetical protein M0R04_13540 [Candidatus Dojkabacteria bacterium]|jgi:hypothetical protein|nr:hypothetical protein [Candidatus Dojkabacteria bacterium]